MSRSNPSDNAVNPAVRWFEWNGEHGVVRYYDKDAKKNVDVGADFAFILLDEVASVRGWHDDSQSGIYSNEVRDTTQEAFVVKAFKGGILAEGLYSTIKDRVKSEGGHYTAHGYLAFKDNGELKIGVLRFKGAALGAWMDFRKEHRADLYSKAIRIKGFEEGKKGRVIFRVPVFKIASVDRDTDRAALKLDEELQAYFAAYFKRTKRQQVEKPHEVPDNGAYTGDDEVDAGVCAAARGEGHGTGHGGDDPVLEGVFEKQGRRDEVGEMSYHWITFEDRKPGFVETLKGEDVSRIAGEFGKVKQIDRLPYPADPILRRPEGLKDPCPPFCYTPNQCKGRSCCPKSYACSE